VLIYNQPPYTDMTSLSADGRAVKWHTATLSLTKLTKKIRKESTLKFEKMTLCQFDGWKRVKTVATNDCQGRRKLRKVGGGGSDGHFSEQKGT
jgi:hypothetical protein